MSVGSRCEPRVNLSHAELGLTRQHRDACAQPADRCDGRNAAFLLGVCAAQSLPPARLDLYWHQASVASAGGAGAAAITSAPSIL